VAGAFFMEMLDGTVIATALPQMAHSFGVPPVDLNIGMTAYLLTLAVFIPISGWIADRVGTRTVFGSAIGLFTIASVLCGLSTGLGFFTLARILQGIGGAMMVPVGRLVVLRSTAKKDLMGAIATIVWPGLVAPVLGPPLGGFITTYFSWPWIFFLNLPLGVLGLIFTAWLIPNHRGEEKRLLDFIGFLLSGLACVLLVYGLDLMGRQQGAGTLAVWIMGAGFLIGCGGIWHLRRHPTPLLDFSALRVQTYAVSIWGGSVFRIAIGTAPFLLPLMFQIGFGMDAFTAGLLVLPVFAGNLVMKAWTTSTLRRFGFRRVLLVNGLFTALSLFACGLLWPETSKIIVVAVLFFGGLCRSMQFTSFSTIAFADVPQEQMNGANTLFSTIMQLTMGLGVAVGAVALHASAWMRHVLGRPPDVTDFHIAFFLMAALALIGVLDSFALPPDAGKIVSGHEK
jgi:EmrB/QacA subfamily drug resistance transporter